MSWQGILGHDLVIEQFRRGLEQGRLATTFLFIGPEGIGKRTLALKLAQALLCTRNAETDLDPCGDCPECQQVDSDSHPDLQVVCKPPDRSFIPVETFIGDREHRMREGLCHFMSLTPAGGRRRIAIVDDADWLNQEGANSLLKTLEEPSPGAVIILIGTSAQRQLPTIRSRSQLIRFHPLTTEQVVACLLDQSIVEDRHLAEMLAEQSEGSVAMACTLADDAIAEFRQQLWRGLAEPTIDRGQLAKLTNEFVDSAGKELASKRRQLQIALKAAAEFHRCALRKLSGIDDPLGSRVEKAVATACENNAWTPETAAYLTERSLDAMRQVNANANVSLLIDSWLCDLALATRTGHPLTQEA